MRLLQEASGQAVIGISVIDPAGNTWQDTFTLQVEAVDDPPVVAEFQSLIPVEREVESIVNMSWSDVDSTQVTASTNRTWATVDLANNVLHVVPPTVGFQTVLVTVCDQTSCTEREVDFEVMALADLVVESVDFGSDELSQGDVIAMRVLVRNQGQADATMVSVRCETEDQLIGVEVIALIEPGELRAVTCDWQIPDDSRVIRFNAVVDRGLEIPEGDESNNAMERLMAINEQLPEDTSQSETFLSSTAAVVLIGLVSVGLLGLIAFFMPAKIKKIE